MDQKLRNKYTAVIGLEVHAQLLTKSKIFSADSTKFGEDPNTNISVITLAHPGTLPKLNKSVVEMAIKMGLACNCEISRENIFDRKNYFYPDLPKGYQITQDKTPICKGGFVSIHTSQGNKDVRLHKIHMEEDAGKSIHTSHDKDSLVDLNRAGIPLIEIVTQPDLSSSEEAAELLAEIRKIVRYLDICDGNMEEGSFRCDANISVMLKDAREYGNKVEVKNMNSFKNVQRAIDFEIERQILEVEEGNVILQETRLFDASKGTTSGMREKEQLTDYRYFPEPDLSPLIISDEWLDEIKSKMPALPSEKKLKFINEYQLPEYDAKILSESKEVAHFFEQTCCTTKNYKAVSNWLMGPIKSLMNETSRSIDQVKIMPAELAELINLIDQGKINYTVASQKIFPEMIKTDGVSPLKIAQQNNLIQVSDSGNIQPIIDEVIKNLPEKVAEYRKGKKGLIGLFMGEVMKKSKGKVDPKLTNKMLRETLDTV